MYTTVKKYHTYHKHCNFNVNWSKNLGRKKKKKPGEEEWTAVAQEDFFKASEKELEERERKRKEREEEEAKRAEEQVDSNLSISILRKKGNDRSSVKESDFFKQFLYGSFFY